ncbi:AAA family ATPase [Hydrogenobacter hydrogenophilus]|uniref:Exonuclease SbcC n=1 Tax=Hydrogenobacter hydrogenophilus TaxID=35835 RepID=A0A285P1W0_9AQUI|nr:AAA family ATPase [Hydrogenobacter hydrogenophilus]SNZ15715.1 exonuclease SbcC [Hydrogenobacter hydrogenophilus]
MRPILLELENFTVYRRQMVDFSDLNFFIIQGRTGAGKTSLIDAICYALYGKVPRYKGTNPQEYLLSKGQRRMRVRFEFSVKDKRYTVDRLYEISKPQVVRFYEGSKPLNLKVKEVEDYISKILGMDYETFTKVIVLPQGQFDRFLKPQRPTERREILNKLLGYDKIFEKMNQIIKETLNDLKGKKRVLEAEYSNLVNITEETVVNMEHQLENKKRQIEVLEREKEKLRSQLSRAMEKERIEEELSNKKSKLSELLKEQEQMQKKQEKLSIAKEISGYEHFLKEYEQLEKKSDELIEEKKRLESGHIMYKHELQNVEEELKSVEKEYEKLGELSSEIGHLKIERDLINQLLKIEEKIKQTTLDLEEKQKLKENLEEELKHLQENLKSKEDRLSQIEKQLKDLEGIEAKYAEAKERKTRYDELSKINLEIQKIEIQMKNLEELLKKLQFEREKLESKLFEASIHQIALRLSPGQLCPVCGNRIQTLPALSEKGTEEFTHIKQELEKIRQQEQKVISDIASQENRKKDLEQKRNELVDYEDFYKTYSQLKEKYETFLKLKEEEKQIRKQREDLMPRVLKKSEELTAIRTSLEHLNKDLAELNKGKQELLERLSRKIEDPYKELLAIERELIERQEIINQVQEKYKKIRDYRESLKAKLSIIEEKLRQNESDREDTRKKLGEIYQVLLPAIKKFGNIESLKSLCVPKEELQKLEEEISQYNMSVKSLQEELQSLEKALAQYPQDINRRSIEEELRSLENTINQIYQEVGSLSKDLQQAKENLRRKKEVEQELTQLTQELQKYEVLERDMRSDHFPDFISRYMLHSILDRASYYILKFSSGLYEFKLVDDERDNLYIIDRSSGYERSVLTLSGGETFLASLSLAFAVSDIVSHNAPLESIFIDEGFGSLDRETRESLGEFFEFIKLNAGRMVGIISHLEDLAEKFDQRILIEKKGDQSFVKVEIT